MFILYLLHIDYGSIPELFITFNDLTNILLALNKLKKHMDTMAQAASNTKTHCHQAYSHNGSSSTLYQHMDILTKVTCTPNTWAQWL